MNKIEEIKLRRMILREVKRVVREDAVPGKIDSRLFPTKLSAVDKDAAKQLATTGMKDKQHDDDTAGTETVSKPAIQLKASQTTMDFGKFVGMAIQMLGKIGSFSGGAGGDLGAIVSSDDHIMDGHHRWAATLMVDPDASVGGLLVNLPGEKLLGVLNVWTAAHDQTGKPSDTDLGSITGDDVAQKFTEMASKGGKFLPTPEEMLAAFKKSGFDSLEAAAQHVKSNWEESASARKIMGWMPPKVDMPAIEPDQLSQVAKDINTGKMDINPPYSPEVKSAFGMNGKAEESARRNGNVVLERWQKLAGIIK